MSEASALSDSHFAVSCFPQSELGDRNVSTLYIPKGLVSALRDIDRNASPAAAVGRSSTDSAGARSEPLGDDADADDDVHSDAPTTSSGNGDVQSSADVRSSSASPPASSSEQCASSSEPCSLPSPSASADLAEPPGGTCSGPDNPACMIDEPYLLKKVAENRRLKRVYTAEEVAEHRSARDCWMIINGCVYDITPYIGHHPGGSRALLKFAGRDGTENVQFHSREMMRLLRTYFYQGRLAGAGRSCVIS
eukprot:TRINITY_DN6006_c0_g1_i1.p1 TRINITY_DN6006_c0_g1~~TRINITY_DN6006_c0_g1_i1.p1  ORF type:complete len:250 (-),score=59.72 TRINITY_DN6006_c0_g1_i1:493-1242(-)